MSSTYPCKAIPVQGEATSVESLLVEKSDQLYRVSGRTVPGLIASSRIYDVGPMGRRIKILPIPTRREPGLCNKPIYPIQLDM